MKATIWTGLLAAGLVSPTILAAQAELERESVPVFRRSHGVYEGGERARGGGADYKVEFERGRLLFTPALGRGAPRNMPLSFTLESIRRGGNPLYRTESDADRLEPWTEANSIHCRRGPGVVENYEVLPEGVEQSFTFEEALPGTGDLVVRGRLETELVTPFRGETGGGLRFEAPGLGAVTYGAVTGIVFGLVL